MITAPLSSVLDCGENAMVGWGGVRQWVRQWGRERQSSRPSGKVGVGENGKLEAWINVYIGSDSVRAMPKMGMYICARTIARTRQHADKEHQKHDAEIPR